MYDLLFNLSANYPAWLIAFMIAFSVLVGIFGGAMIMSVRWAWVRKTRLPRLWRDARAAYEREIATLKAENLDLWEQLQKAQSAGYGKVIFELRKAVGIDREVTGGR
jgi:hypothetical protein